MGLRYHIFIRWITILIFAADSVKLSKIIIFRFLPYDGLTFFPFIFLRKRKLKEEPALLNHERIHLCQQRELWILPFYFIYIVNYTFNIIRYLNHHKAYRNIIFEKEAYMFEKDLNYLQQRIPFAFMKWLH